MVDNQRGAHQRAGYNHLISNKREGNNCFNKNAYKISRILPDFFAKTTDFQLILNFEQTCTVTIFGEHHRGSSSYTMMAKAIRALELHYPMIQFFNNIVYTTKKCLLSLLSFKNK